MKTSYWLGYADDIVVKTKEKQEAERFLHRVQAAAAMAGLHLNAKKTKCQPIREGVRQTGANEAEKERAEKKE